MLNYIARERVYNM